MNKLNEMKECLIDGFKRIGASPIIEIDTIENRISIDHDLFSVRQEKITVEQPTIVGTKIFEVDGWIVSQTFVTSGHDEFLYCADEEDIAECEDSSEALKTIIIGWATEQLKSGGLI
jgi:hypothetical protein